MLNTSLSYMYIRMHVGTVVETDEKRQKKEVDECSTFFNGFAFSVPCLPA